MSGVKRCQNCIMPETPGHIEFDANGVCNICLKNSGAQAQSRQKNPEGFTALKKQVDALRASSRGPYDSMVALSGGKDSTMTLYIARRELGLNPLAVFIDNGFCGGAMYHNIQAATDRLGVDLVVLRPQLIKQLFRHLLLQNSRVYYCRICNALIDYYIRIIARQHGIGLLLTGHTKGQEFLKGTEMFWIYRDSDSNLLSDIKDRSEFRIVSDMFASLTLYFHRTFGSITALSPFHYIDYEEDEIYRTLFKELDFKLPEASWPQGSTNCLFNFVAQLLTVRFFGYSQHEAEISALVRNHEMTRQRALEIIETPISQLQVNTALERIGLSYSDIS